MGYACVDKAMPFFSIKKEKVDSAPAPPRPAGSRTYEMKTETRITTRQGNDSVVILPSWRLEAYTLPDAR